jgi:hypothetical protein
LVSRRSRTIFIALLKDSSGVGDHDGRTHQNVRQLAATNYDLHRHRIMTAAIYFCAGVTDCEIVSVARSQAGIHEGLGACFPSLVKEGELLMIVDLEVTPLTVALPILGLECWTARLGT